MNLEELTIPDVHMNGTSKGGLTGPLYDAYAAVQQARDALCQTGPNGRDYYTRPGTMDRAVRDHSRRVKTLTDLMEEVDHIIGKIEAQ